MGCAYPSLADIREVSLNIAVAVAEEVFNTGRELFLILSTLIFYLKTSVTFPLPLPYLLASSAYSHPHLHSYPLVV